jgi:hypothetical protein
VSSYLENIRYNENGFELTLTKLLQNSQQERRERENHSGTYSGSDAQYNVRDGGYVLMPTNREKEKHHMTRTPSREVHDGMRMGMGDGRPNSSSNSNIAHSHPVESSSGVKMRRRSMSIDYGERMRDEGNEETMTGNLELQERPKKRKRVDTEVNTEITAAMNGSRNGAVKPLSQQSRDVLTGRMSIGL